MRYALIYILLIVTYTPDGAGFGCRLSLTNVLNYTWTTLIKSYAN